MNDDIHFISSEIESRSRTIPPPKSIAEAMSGLLAKRGYAQIQSSSELDEVWNATVGQPLNEQTKPGRIRGGVLEVIVSNSVVVQELTFRKAELIDQLGKSGLETAVTDLRLRVGIIE